MLHRGAGTTGAGPGGTVAALPWLPGGGGNETSGNIHNIQWKAFALVSLSEIGTLV